MSKYKITVNRIVKVGGNFYKPGETVEVNEKAFQFLKSRNTFSHFEEVESKQEDNNKLPDYKKITGEQIQERLTELKVDFEGVTDKKDLYALLEEALKEEGE